MQVYALGSVGLSEGEHGYKRDLVGVQAAWVICKYCLVLPLSSHEEAHVDYYIDVLLQSPLHPVGQGLPCTSIASATASSGRQPRDARPQAVIYGLLLPSSSHEASRDLTLKESCKIFL